MASESGYSQINRQIAVTTPLGDDVLLLRNATITERLSAPFECDLELLSEDDGISPASLLGEPVTVRLDLQHEGQRFFNGLVSHFSHIGFEGRLARYRAKLVPWLWLLTRTSDCRIFSHLNTGTQAGEMTALDVVKTVFDEHGFPYDYKRLSETGDYRKWAEDEICVQYRETDFNFVSRLMENEGICYFFEHEEDKHGLVLADSYSCHKPVSGYEQIPYHARDLAASREQDFVFDWSLSSRLRSGAFVHDEFDFKNPGGELRAASTIPREHAHAELEIFDYPGEYLDEATGNRYASVRMQELQADHEIVRAEGYARGVAAGSLFELTDYPRDDQNREYLIISAQHQLRTDEYQTDRSPESGQVYQSSFSAMDSGEIYRPPRLTPQPIVQGPQTAIVVGDAGAEILTDKYSRVKVQFHWDRYGNMDENSCCFIRVSTDWAGKNWGAIAIPRIGQEVIVSFLEGDPDRPMITGRVYNNDQMPPWGLPANATQSGILSRSSKGGSAANANAIRMEDKKGSEQLWIHAEKNQDIEVENDETHWVGHDRTKTIDHDETSHIKHDRTETVDNNETITVHGQRTETVDKNETITIHQNRTETVDKNETITIHGARTEKVDKNETITIDGARTETVAKDETITIKGGRTESVTKNENISISGGRTESVTKDESITINGGRTESVTKDESVSVKGARSHSVTKDDSLKVGKNLVVDAGDSITIKTGKASITMNKDGTITIKGKDITVDGGGEINVKAKNNVVTKGKKILQN